MKIEEVRCEFILYWNTFLRLSGCVVLENPKFEQCLIGMLWKLSADMNVNISKIG